MTDKNPLAHYSGVLSEAVQESAAANLPASGAAALGEYLKDCDEHLIVPDVGGAFAFAFAAGFNLAITQAAPAAVAVPDEREEFEEWATLEGYEGFERAMRGTGHYHSIQLEQLWQSWTSSRAALAATPAAVEAPATERMMQLVDAWFGQMKSGNVISQGMARQRIVMFVDTLAATPAAAAPVVLTEQDAILLNQAIELLEDLSGEKRRRGDDSTAEGAACSAHAVQRLGGALLSGLCAPAVPTFCDVAQRKLQHLLQERGFSVTGYAIEKPVDGAQPERGFINHGGFVGWWWDGQTPQAQADARDAEQEKPPAGRYVLAWMEGREIPIRAMWVPKSWLVAGDECPEGWAEYDEEKDEYYCPEGWYEANEHEETHWHVSTPIVAWADLPRRAAIAAQAAQQGGA